MANRVTQNKLLSVQELQTILYTAFPDNRVHSRMSVFSVTERGAIVTQPAGSRFQGICCILIIMA